GKRFVWWIKDELDLARMQEASRFFVGLKDFKNFAAKDGEADSTKVNLEELRIESRGDLILIRVVGSHFLWKMVRQITGILAEVGRGNMKPGDIAGLFRQTSPSLARLTAPPSGLFLERVYYKNDERLQTLEPFLAIR
ncbi:MAG TPA: tRNA pseudouridine(38-40) synthase TruA, partial [bacterium]|nr:tRNA pseudouridine(38-40) synthase TruA [bacterium]